MTRANEKKPRRGCGCVEVQRGRCARRTGHSRGWLWSPSADRPCGSRRFRVACICSALVQCIALCSGIRLDRRDQAHSRNGLLAATCTLPLLFAFPAYLWRVSRPSGLQRKDRREREPAGLRSPSYSHSVSLFYGSPFARSLELKPRRHARNRHGQLYGEHQRNRAGSEFGHDVAIRPDAGETC
jgi:hypothetical protein